MGISLVSLAYVDHFDHRGQALFSLDLLPLLIPGSILFPFRTNSGDCLSFQRLDASWLLYRTRIVFP